MDVTAVAASQSASKPSAFSQLTENFDTFLTLLTTQLRNQDPLDPLDTEKFTSQLVEFASVEQTIQTNQHLETLIGLQAAADRSGALAMIGQTIAIDGDVGFNDGGGADWNYHLPQGAATVTLSIVNEAGKTIADYAADASAGDHAFSWNGLLSDGKPAPAGAYRLIVNAADATGAPAAFSVQSLLDVSGVTFTEAGPELDTATGAVSLEAVRRVINPS